MTRGNTNTIPPGEGPRLFDFRALLLHDWVQTWEVQNRNKGTLEHKWTTMQIQTLFKPLKLCTQEHSQAHTQTSCAKPQHKLSGGAFHTANLNNLKKTPHLWLFFPQCSDLGYKSEACAVVWFVFVFFFKCRGLTRRWQESCSPGRSGGKHSSPEQPTRHAPLLGCTGLPPTVPTVGTGGLAASGCGWCDPAAAAHLAPRSLPEPPASRVGPLSPTALDKPSLCTGRLPLSCQEARLPLSPRHPTRWEERGGRHPAWGEHRIPRGLPGNEATPGWASTARGGSHAGTHGAVPFQPALSVTLARPKSTSSKGDLIWLDFSQ